MTQFDRIIQLLELIRQSINVLAERQSLDTLIEIAREQLQLMQCLKERTVWPLEMQEATLPEKQQAYAVRVLDNADIKQMLKIGDTKLYYLKKKKILKPYNLDGKEVYLEHEVIEAIKESDK